MSQEELLDKVIADWCKKHISGNWGIFYQTLQDKDESLAKALSDNLTTSMTALLDEAIVSADFTKEVKDYHDRILEQLKERISHG